MPARTSKVLGYPKISLSAFFPAYNEEKNIKNTIEQASSVLLKLNLKNYEIIVINDGSSDKTAEIVEDLAVRNSKVKLVSHPKNRGYGGALKTGFESSKYPWVAFADSDGQFNFGQITLFLDKADDADLILGYRLNRADPFVRSVTTFGWRTLAWLLLGLNVKDYSCGFKLIKKAVYEKVQPLVGEEKVTQIELLVKAKRLGFKFTEVGVKHLPRKFGTQTGANFKVVLKSIGDLIKLWWAVKK